MSVKVMGAVWDADLPRDEKFVLLSYADHAAHDGTGVYPSIYRMAWKTGFSRRSVQRITRKLEEKKIIVPDGCGPHGTNRWRIDLDALPERDAFADWRKEQREKDGRRGGRQPDAPQGGDEGRQPDAPGAAPVTPGGAAPVTPKPSFNHQPTVMTGAGAPDDLVSEETRSAQVAADNAASEAEFEEAFPGNGSAPVEADEDPGPWIARHGADERPWMATATWIRSRNGVSAESLQRVQWIVEEHAGLEPTEDERKGWAKALETIYRAAKGDFAAVEAGVKAAWAREPRYRPGHARGFVDEVRKAGAIASAKDARVVTVAGAPHVCRPVEEVAVEVFE